MADHTLILTFIIELLLLVISSFALVLVAVISPLLLPLSIPGLVAVPILYFVAKSNARSGAIHIWRTYCIALLCGGVLGICIPFVSTSITKLTGDEFTKFFLIAIPFIIPMCITLAWAALSTPYLTKPLTVITAWLVISFTPVTIIYAGGIWWLRRDTVQQQKLAREEQQASEHIRKFGINSFDSNITKGQENALVGFLNGDGPSEISISGDVLKEAARRYRAPMVLEAIADHPNCTEECLSAVYESALYVERSKPEKYLGAVWDALGRSERTPVPIL